MDNKTKTFSEEIFKKRRTDLSMIDGCIGTAREFILKRLMKLIESTELLELKSLDDLFMLEFADVDIEKYTDATCWVFGFYEMYSLQDYRLRQRPLSNLSLEELREVYNWVLYDCVKPFVKD